MATNSSKEAPAQKARSPAEPSTTTLTSERPPKTRTVIGQLSQNGTRQTVGTRMGKSQVGHTTVCPPTARRPSSIRHPAFNARRGAEQDARCARVDLTWAADGLAIFRHLLPLGNPTRQAAQGKHHREHLRGNAQGAVDDAAVEVHIGVQAALARSTRPSRPPLPASWRCRAQGH